MEYLVWVVTIGIAALGMAWMPTVSNLIRISYSIVYILLGILLFSIVPMLPYADPLYYSQFTLHLTETVVLVALMGSGLKIDQPFSFKEWRYPLRLVSVGMISCIAVTALAAWAVTGMDLASALLLGAILSPTDPVLASDVQVEPPHEGVKDTVKFTLTAEGGMNDGTAFPFVWLGILMATGSFAEPGAWMEWTGFYFLYKLLCGLAVGFLLGKVFGYVLFSLPEKYRAARIEDGFVALSITMVVYGCTELLNGYGFIAVFTCAVTLRNYEMGHALHRTLHAFSDQIERMLVAIVLLLFGGSLVNGILNHLSWPQVILGVSFLLIIRPIVTWLTLSRTKLKFRERSFLSFFGIRGVGSLYYMSFATQQISLPWLTSMWSTVAFVILLSVVIHGLTASAAISKLENFRKKSKIN
ncbi:cation:proton antiporter [Longitalea arenae]|uniref:cation:proton antiporter n=1 Tax=Longitalea arenae TaxID=2812558 RepID=UPI001968135F|nr:cation:proton antiporter [Longitalea arenae]